jgi:protein-disulfide isomerase
MSCLTYAAAAVLIVALTGFLAEKMQQQNSMYGGVDRALKDYREAKQMFLPPEAYSGPQTKGSPSGQAVMQIVEFSDLECPACRLAAQYFKPFLLKHSKDVSFSYRHFPLDGACNPYSPNGMHANACNAAKAAICAGEQGKFYAFHDAAFDNQENFSAALFKQFANDLQLDKSAWEACLEAPSTRARLEQDMQWGNQIGLQSTPTIMINGRKLSGGAIHPAQLEVLLEALKNGTADAPKHGESH